jgi:hypothetical protein
MKHHLQSLATGSVFFIFLIANARSFSFGPTTAPSITKTSFLLYAKENDFEPSRQQDLSPEDVIQQCANQQNIDAATVISALETLESRQRTPVDETTIDGNFELIFSSAVANLPVLGKVFDGYMPNKEIITFDIERNQMSLVVELLPFLPTIDIYGDALTFDEGAATLEYTIRGKEGKTPSKWKLLYADGDVVAARSSVTGLNVIRRV